MSRKRVDAAVLVLALLARLFVLYLAIGGHFLVGEGIVQANLAENILSGKGFMLSQSLFYSDDPRRDANLEFFRSTGGFYGALIPEQPTSFMVPGYALFQAFIFMMTSPGDLIAVIAVQLALGILTVFLGLRLASRFLNGFWYVAAGVFMALDPFELYYQAIPVTQALFSLLFVAGLLLSMRFLEVPGVSRGVLSGLVWGAAFMVRPVALPMVLWLAVVFLVWKKFSLRSILPVGVLLAVFFMTLVPWMIRNRATMGRYQLLPLQGGVQMWEFNGMMFTDHFEGEQEGARILYEPIRNIWLGRLNSPDLAEFPDFALETEFERDSILYSRQIRFIRANPVVFLQLASCRFVEFFKPFPLNRFSVFHTVAGLLSFFWVGLFFAAGLVIMLKKMPGGVYISGVIAGYVLMHLLTASGTPHRVALDIPLAIAALVGLEHCRLRSAAGRKTG